MMLENVLQTVDENPNLDHSIKENIKGLVIIFSNIFPNVSLSNLNERLKTLVIDKASKFEVKTIYKYNPMTNILSFNMEKLKEEYDMKHVMMSALLTIMTSHDDTYGFDHHGNLASVNIGYTEVLTNFLVGNEGDISLWDDEVILANVIAELIGSDVMFKAYFGNDFETVEAAIKKVG